MRRDAVALLSGALFSAGLCLSGMTHPSKILAFLDVTGAWDPSLAMVMLGAVAVTALASRFGARQAKPVLDERFYTVARSEPIDARLLAGAAVFGIGWGLSGLCPGPAVVSLASAQPGALVFVASMIAGMALHRFTTRPATPEAQRVCA